VGSVAPTWLITLLSYPSAPVPNYPVIYRIVVRNNQNGSDSIKTQVTFGNFQLQTNSLGSGIPQRSYHFLMSSQDSFYFEWPVDSFIAMWKAEWVNVWMDGWMDGWVGRWERGRLKSWTGERKCRLYAWINGWMSEGVDGRINGRVVGYMSCSYISHSF
jgi:hypothetical protein